MSLDEAYLVSKHTQRYSKMSHSFKFGRNDLFYCKDITEYIQIKKSFGDSEITPAFVVDELRSKIFERTGLTASAGIAPNTFLAKVRTTIRFENENSFSYWKFLSHSEVNIIKLMQVLQLQ